jgi:trk system potassium uptake protein TrkA
MIALIVGGGRGGSYLAHDLEGQGYAVKIIDKRPDVVAKLRQEFGGTIVCGDGCSPTCLEEAGIEKASLVVAMTPDDEDNLVVCRLAKRHFGVARVIARVNNPRNQWLYTRAWGVDVAVSQVHITAKVIEEEIGLGELVTLLKLQRGEIALVELVLPDGGRAVGRAIRDLGLPSESIIVSIIRDGRLVFPRGEAILQAQDEVLAVTTVRAEADLKAALVAR